MPAGEGGSLFRALTRPRGVVNTYLMSAWPWRDAAEACGLGATPPPVRHRRDVETNYSVVYESHFFLCLIFSFVCALVCGHDVRTVFGSSIYVRQLSVRHRRASSW